MIYKQLTIKTLTLVSLEEEFVKLVSEMSEVKSWFVGTLLPSACATSEVLRYWRKERRAASAAACFANFLLFPDPVYTCPFNYDNQIVVRY